MIVVGQSFKPRTKKQIYKALGEIDLPKVVVKYLVDIAYEFDCMVRDTAAELIKVRKENVHLHREIKRLISIARNQEDLLYPATAKQLKRK